MFTFFLYSILLVFLMLIFWEDHKNRLVDVRFFIGLLFVSLIIFFLKNRVLLNIYYNAVFLIINLLTIKLYTFLIKKEKSDKFYVIPGIAEGDIAFLFVIIPLFSFHNYVLFYISGLLVSIVLHLIIRQKIDRRKTIPLAGYLALYLFFLFLTIHSLGENLYNTFL